MSSTKKKKTLVSYAVNLILTGLLFVVLFLLMNTGVMNRYQVDLVTMVCINVILAVSLNLGESG